MNRKQPRRPRSLLGGIPDNNLQSLIGSFTDPSRAVIKCHNVLKYIHLLDPYCYVRKPRIDMQYVQTKRSKHANWNLK